MPFLAHIVKFPMLYPWNNVSDKLNSTSSLPVLSGRAEQGCHQSSAHLSTCCLLSSAMMRLSPLPQLPALPCPSSFCVFLAQSHHLIRSLALRDLSARC